MFKIIPNADLSNVLDGESDEEGEWSTPDSIVTCTSRERIKSIPLDDMFISHCYKVKHVKRETHGWDIRMTLHRKNGKRLLYHFKRSYGIIWGSGWKSPI